MAEELANFLVFGQSFLEGLNVLSVSEVKLVEAADRPLIANLVEHAIELAQHKQSATVGPRKRTGDKLLRFANRISEFIDIFSGFADIVKGIHQQAGPIAYGTFAVLLMVARNRKVQDDLITHTLGDLHRWLSRLAQLDQVEQTRENVQTLIICIYEQIVRFAQYSIQYYCLHWWQRLVRTITNPPQVYVQRQVNEIKESIANLMSEVTVVQYVRIVRLSQWQADEQGQAHNDRVCEIAELFKISPDITAETMRARSKQAYTGKFATGASKLGQGRKALKLQEASLGMLSDIQIYSDWLHGYSSSLLVLAGQNYTYGVDASWLSPIPASFYNSITESKNVVAAFYSLNTINKLACSSSACLIIHMMKTIIWQILEQNHQLCRERINSIRSSVREAFKLHPAEAHKVAQCYSVDSTEDLISVLFDVLAKIIESCPPSPSPPVYICVDGIETLQAQWTQSFFQPLLELMDTIKKGPLLKVLVTSKSSHWPNVRQNDGDELRFALGLGGARDAMQRVYAELALDQSVLDKPAT